MLSTASTVLSSSLPTAVSTALPSNRHCWYGLYALQQWECLGLTREGRPYGPGFFPKAIPAILAGLNHLSRTTVLKHLATPVCLACALPIDLSKTRGDHLIPLARGGTESLENTLLLCRRCNSSKGTKDVLEWWLFLAREPFTLPRRVLVLYARLSWQRGVGGHLPPPSWLIEFVAKRMVPLPTATHQCSFLDSCRQGVLHG